MKNLLSKKSSSPQAILVILLVASVTIISAASSYSIKEAMAFPHASLIIVPDENDPIQEHANPIRLVLGHTNEPAYGKLPGIHDGKHFVEIDLTDEATTLPIQGDNETADPELGLVNTEIIIDKYYFKDIESFQNADSLEDADAFELNVPMSSVFGQPGVFYDRQVIDPGIYGYTVRGVINYYDVANVPIPESTKFCSIEGAEDILSKFDTPGWTGSYGCPENIKEIFFPPADPRPYPPKYDNDDGYYGSGYDNNNNNYDDYSNNEEGEYENPKERYISYEDRENNYRPY
jgi:hypothetical protein